MSTTSNAITAAEDRHALSRTAPPWSDEVTRSSLQLIAEGLVELAGFGVAAIAIHGDDGLLHTVAVAGDDAAREQLGRGGLPISQLGQVEELADTWGMFWFVPEERRDGSALPLPRYVPELDRVESQDAWLPLDLLMAPLRDDTGRLRGTLSVDRPADGRRPGPRQRADLNRYAGMARRTIVTALERERLADQVRLAAAAREVIRQATGDLGLDRVLEQTGQTLLSAFGADWLWMRILSADGEPLQVVHVGAEKSLSEEPQTREYALRTARRLWAEGQLQVVHTEDIGGHEPELRRAREVAVDTGVGGWLLVPLGVGTQLLGTLTLARWSGAPRWTEPETDTALDIAGDLGRVLLNAREYRHEQTVVRELRALDDYKNRLIRSVSDDLATPLATISAGAGRLVSHPLPEQAAPLAESVQRSSDRLERLVSDLQLLSRVSDPRHPFTRTSVRLDDLVRTAVRLTSPVARQRGVRLTTRLPQQAVRVLGDATELDRALLNLLGNAVKYSESGGQVTVSVADRGGEVELAVADDGIGISEADQDRLFVEFFRSAAPRARERSGTGLGLPIVSHIVKRHGGRVEVSSTLGAGSTFTIVLAAEPA